MVAENDEMLTPLELAARLKMSRKTVYDRIRAKEIPGVRKVGRHIRIHWSTVAKWISTGHGSGR